MAGSYRPKSYGVEYRVLSNFWWHHPLIYQFIFRLARASAYFYSNSRTQHKEDRNQLLEFSNLYSEDIQRAINKCDATLAQELLLRSNVYKYMKNYDYLKYVGSNVTKHVTDMCVNSFDYKYAKVGWPEKRTDHMNELPLVERWFLNQKQPR